VIVGQVESAEEKWYKAHPRLGKASQQAPAAKKARKRKEK
jgi:hypothetical protein